MSALRREVEPTGAALRAVIAPSPAEVVERVWHWSRNRDYCWYTKHDGLNSPLLRLLLGFARWPRIIAIQIVMRAPINVRPLLGVRKSVNPKGLALFTLGMLDRYRVTHDERYLTEAEALLARLRTLVSPGAWSGPAWGYPYPWQDLGFFAPTHTPNAVVTTFVCEAFLAAYRLTGRSAYLDIVGAARRFFLQDLTVLKDEADELCLGYMPMPMTMRVMDVSILIAAVLAQHARLSGDDSALPQAERLLRYVVRRQTPEGAWYYTDPPGDSPVRIDNYHTGFILDALDRYSTATGSDTWREQYRRGLDFYARNLFTDEGAPKWMSDRVFPHDVHGAAQGIITFSRHLGEYPGFAERVAAWSVATLYDPEGRFYYQRTRYFTKRFTLMRWCNAWMVRALSRLIAAQEGIAE